MRIQAGEHKGRKLLSPPGQSRTRPITGSVKKSLFDILGGRLVGARVLDLYCGTGTLGLEALSRGAAACCFADRDRSVLGRLRRNIEALGVAGRCTVWAGDVTQRLGQWVRSLAGKVDVAFVDPPYADARRWSWPAVTQQVFDPLCAALADDGIVVLRLPGRIDLPGRLGRLAVGRVKQYGDMVLALMAKADEAAFGDPPPEGPG